MASLTATAIGICINSFAAYHAQSRGAIIPQGGAGMAALQAAMFQAGFTIFLLGAIDWAMVLHQKSKQGGERRAHQNQRNSSGDK